ncbi:MAG TPA: class II glutamine amidotransferase [Polyangiaceae bacterium]|nr:class II glutamine amidotransferase [Polyangiaceae bacterium]
MLGVVASRPLRVDALLCDAESSLATLSKEHADGWGIARRARETWIVERGTERAAGSASFERAARTGETHLLVAHVRKKTVGPTSLSNTHPFVRGSYVLAHNGTITDVARLARSTSKERADEVAGDTDSERLFAFVLTQIDEVGVLDGLARATAVLRAAPSIGTASFLFSDGVDLHAFAWGRELHLLSRGEVAAPRERRLPAITVASQPLTREPWQRIVEGELVHVGGPASFVRAA